MTRCSPSLLTAIAVTVALCPLASGCGGSSPGSSAAVGTSSSAGRQSPAEMQQDAVRFSDCMRSHGVSSFPDPTNDPHGFKIMISPESGNAKSLLFHSALAACRHLLPGGDVHTESAAESKARLVAMLAFAHCMRSHGFPRFPDPTSSGQLSHEMLANAGIDIHQPAVVQAADGCTSVTHGLLTKADVARFVAGR